MRRRALHIPRFSALQRAEIAEIGVGDVDDFRQQLVSVLFNEPKLLKSRRSRRTPPKSTSFSALQRAEIAEMDWRKVSTTRR